MLPPGGLHSPERRQLLVHTTPFNINIVMSRVSSFSQFCHTSGPAEFSSRLSTCSVFLPSGKPSGKPSRKPSGKPSCRRLQSRRGSSVRLRLWWGKSSEGREGTLRGQEGTSSEGGEDRLRGKEGTSSEGGGDSLRGKEGTSSEGGGPVTAAVTSRQQRLLLAGNT